MCSSAEHQAIDALIDKGPTLAGEMDRRVVQGLNDLSYRILTVQWHIMKLSLKKRE